jgi:hypothetical protein
MKKLLIGFLAVGLIMGFAMTASAQPNIKASGQLYMYGAYADDNSLLKNGNSRANVANRLRMQFEIQVQEGLKLTTRFDALERVWGQTPAVLTQTFSYNSPEQNISWERAYVTFNALYGVFDVGYQQSRRWGTCAFCDDSDSDAGIHYRYLMGPWTLGLEWEKRAGTNNNWSLGLPPEQQGEGSAAQGGTNLPGTDNDHDVYHIYGIYRWSTGQAGLRFELNRDAADGEIAANQTALASYFGGVADAYTYTFYELAPYFQWTYGSFDFEGELRYVWGTIDRDNPANQDIDRNGYSLYLMGKYSMGAFYGGLEFAYMTGDDPATSDKYEAGVAGGTTWDPMLIYGNYWYNKFQGSMGPGTGATIGNQEMNVIMFKPFVGWKVNPQLEIVAQYAWLKAEEVAAGRDDEYGKEFDLYATYKLYNNLSYTVGFAYFWTGDWFKGTAAQNFNIDDNYLVMNALNLTF